MPVTAPKYHKDQVIRLQFDSITIKYVYPPGHRRANESSYFYLIDSNNGGQDTWSEYGLTQIINDSLLNMTNGKTRG